MELQKLLQDEIREGLYRITISGPRGDSEVSKAVSYTHLTLPTTSRV